MSEVVSCFNSAIAIEWNKYYHEGGKLIARPLPGDEVVISGMSGVFPNTSDIYQLKENLFNKVDMVQPHARWDSDRYEIPSRSGLVLGISKYDAGFFGVLERQANSMDPMVRIFQEKAMEAIYDAGFHPSELEGTKTGVYVGVITNENDKSSYFDNNLSSQTFAVTGCEWSMIAHRLSYFLKLKGPSFALNTGCSSSAYALENAYKAIRLGEIDKAIVGATHLSLHPHATMQYMRMGALSKDGACKSFDVRADGFVRSESTAVVVLQKAKQSKRVYTQVVHAKTNCDGFKEQGITFPSRYDQMDNLNEFYEDCDVDRFSLNFVEAHGTGTRVGDPEECAAIDGILTSGRKSPLFIGSLKSNIGHTEPTSGLCSVIKCIIGMESGYIPPNLHFRKPKDTLTGVVEGRMKVVVEKTALDEENALMAVNNFGIGGANAHILLRRNPQPKSKCKDNLPRLVCVSGRTEEAVTILIDRINSAGMDTEYIKLLHEVFGKNIQNHLYRGYTVVSQCREILKWFAFCPQQNQPLHLVFGELDNWYEVGNELMVLPAFRDSILRIQKNLMDKEINILNALSGERFSDREIIPVLGPLSVYITIVHLLNLIDIKPTSSYFAEGLVSAYYHNILTLDETIDCAYALNQAVLNSDKLRNQGNPIQNRKLDLLNDELLLKLCTEKGTKWYKEFKSANCLVDALVKNRNGGMDNIKTNSVILKIGDIALGDKKEVTTVSVFGNGSTNNLIKFFEGLGSLYVNGLNPRVDRLYPKVDFPVGRGTPMISPYIRWNHSKEWFVPQFHQDYVREIKRGIKHYRISLADPKWAFIAGHVVDGRVLFPAAGYQYIVWETFANIHEVQLNTSRVSLRNCKFLRATSIPEKDSVNLTVSIFKGSGEFEVMEGNSTVVTGIIKFLPNNKVDVWNFTSSDFTQSHGARLNKNEVYRELSIQGYRYSGEFQALEEYDLNTLTAYVKWQENWITFLDSIMQSKFLQSDNRVLEVLICIAQLDIEADAHLHSIKQLDSKGMASNLPVHCDLITGRITCGGVTYSGLITSPITRRTGLERPLLEIYEFIPNCAELNLQTSVRVNIQIIIENMLISQFKAVEFIDEFSDSNAELLSPIIKSVLQDQPLIQSFVKIFSEKIIYTDVEVENEKLETEINRVLVIASKIMDRPEVLKSAFATIKENGYVISRESCSFNIRSDVCPDVVIVTVHKTPFETILLLRKQSEQQNSCYVEIDSSENFSWLAKAQNVLRKNSREDLVLYSNDATSGILGLVHCLRKESGNSSNIRCVFVMDEAEAFNPNCDQLKKNMAFNVYKNGKWGTFRHFLLEDSNVESEHCCVKITTKGDLSSLKWVEGPLKHHMVSESGKELVYVYYSSLNFKDIIIAMGKMNTPDMETELGKEVPLGIEFSGKDKRGRRIMGFCMRGALTNLLMADKLLTYDVPDAWTLEEAATVPVIYLTLVYGLIMRGCLRKGESILIHSGTSGVGQAAIHLALHYGCEVFTTVGNQAKREFIKKMYPQMKDENIGNSHDETFEQMVYQRTKGRGVDIVLNSLTEEKMVASVRCLATGGRFLEIANSDLICNNHLSSLLFEKQASFHGVMLDRIPDDKTKFEMKKMFQMLLTEGAVKPLKSHVFKLGEIEQAFRFKVPGNHMSKVLVKVREDEEELALIPSKQILHGVFRYYCDPQKVYIIMGGLGGFGLELANWLVQRGARKLVLTSRKGISTGYQHYRIRSWESYGVLVKISTASAIKREDCKQLLKESLSLGRIAAVFNLAMVLDSAIFENHTIKSFTAAFEPKVAATKHLDDITRIMCKDLRDFVAFSSHVSGKGQGGLTNYGMANSAMERICEKRKRDGYPALAIQWGSVGDVGIVAKKKESHEDVKIAGVTQQSISSCLQVLDTLLAQKSASVVSSVVVTPKQDKLSTNDSVVGSLINILGIRDAKYISLHSTLAELGMDSMMAIEIRLTLERDFGIIYSTKDLRTMSLARLKEQQIEKSGAIQNRSDGQEPHFEMIFKFSEEDLNSKISSLQVVPEVDENSNLSKIVLFPGIQGFSKDIKNFIASLEGAVSLQYPADTGMTSIPNIVEALLLVVEKLLLKDKPFVFVGYSFGAMVALEMVHVLEDKGYIGTLICIDGAPLLFKTLAKNLNKKSASVLETVVIYQLLSCCLPHDEAGRNEDTILQLQTWEEKLNFALELVKNYAPYKAHYLEMTANAMYGRFRDLDTYIPSHSCLQSNVKLFKATSSIVQDIAHDYGLSEFFKKPVEIQLFEGNHTSILENGRLADRINLCLS